LNVFNGNFVPFRLLLPPFANAFFWVVSDASSGCVEMEEATDEDVDWADEPQHQRMGLKFDLSIKMLTNCSITCSRFGAISLIAAE
jgi:hypothetical protein